MKPKLHHPGEFEAEVEHNGMRWTIHAEDHPDREMLFINWVSGRVDEPENFEAAVSAFLTERGIGKRRVMVPVGFTNPVRP